ncbi:thiol-disulfide oxidoreductase ResA [Brevibacillus dissolubilis]|uniref:thiol-disulfide oxidoreductase ResA n=1 Tax=Brevibacillus dissolubilis TaxID=1844116 RepID=UPI0011169826|nr:thiol-disulfide oxidoreductase ResA [Brevibacillus dissolubilis]
MNKENRTPIRVAILGVLVAALVFAIYSSLSQDDVVGKGDTAPNFYSTEVGGKSVQLTDLRGKGVVVNFWGSWCEPCKEEMPALEKMWHTYKDQGVVFIGLNIGESEITATQFAKQMGVTFPIWMDPKREVTKVYKVSSIPATYFIDKDGEIQDVFVGPMSEEIIKEKVEKIKP